MAIKAHPYFSLSMNCSGTSPSFGPVVKVDLDWKREGLGDGLGDGRLEISLLGCNALGLYSSKERG